MTTGISEARLRELLIRRPKAMDDDGKITLEPEERALLADVHNAGAREFEVVKEKGKSTARFDAAHTLLSFWQDNRDFLDTHYGISENAPRTSKPSSEVGNGRVRAAPRQPTNNPESLYSITLPARSIKTAKYLIVADFGTPAKDRWFDLSKLTACVQDDGTKLWTVTAPKRQFEMRGVLENAAPTRI